MKKLNLKKMTIIFSLVALTLIALLINAEAYPSDETSCDSCHGGGYTITADVSSIETQPEEVIDIEITATGPSVVVDVYSSSLDNAQFTISPGNIIADGDPDDTNPAADAITVVLQVTIPAQEDDYTLRILARGALAGGGTPLATLDLQVTVGVVIKPFMVVFFESYNLYIGGVAVFFMLHGYFLFRFAGKDKESNRKKTDAANRRISKNEGSSTTDLPVDIGMEDSKDRVSKLHAADMGIAFILLTINLFLIINDGLYILSKQLELTSSETFGLINHIVFGSVGYIAGIIVIYGTYTDVPKAKLRIVVSMMVLAWLFNFYNGLFIPIPTYDFGGLF